jgi:hypothetical protein
MMLSGTLSSAATSVVKGGSDSRPAASPDAGTSSGAISVGGQSDLGPYHSVATDRRQVVAASQRRNPRGCDDPDRVVMRRKQLGCHLVPRDPTVPVTIGLAR